MTQSRIGFLPIDLNLIWFFANSESTDLSIAVLYFDLEKLVNNTFFGHIFKSIPLDLPLVFCNKGFFLQLYCSFFKLVHIRPKFFLLLL